jgi:hypothetical protein
LLKGWLKESVITIDGRKISTKKNLSDRIVVSPVGVDFDVSRILSKELFTNRVLAHHHIKDRLILELKNMESYLKYLDIGVVRIENTMIEIKLHRLVIDPETIDIHAENWLEQFRKSRFQWKTFKRVGSSLTFLPSDSDVKYYWCTEKATLYT